MNFVKDSREHATPPAITPALPADWITTREAAQILGVGLNWVGSLARAGELEAIKVSGSILVARAAVERMRARRAAVRALQSGELEPGDLGLVPTQRGPWSGQAPRGG